MPIRPRVALLIETSNSYARDLLFGIRTYLREHQSWSINLTEHGRGEGLPAGLQRWQGHGIIARVETEAIATALAATRLPVVDVSAGLEPVRFPRVATDSRAATRLAADHLRGRGFQNFGYCPDARFLWSNKRGEYFAEQLAAEGLGCDQFNAPAGSEPGSAADLGALGGWLAGLRKPVGVLACYDVRGLQVLEACRDAGLSVPEEVAVIGVHNDELLCELCDPPLTSVIPNARRAGYEAAALLERMMRGARVATRAHLIEPIGIAIRQSTDTVAVSDPKVSAAVRFIREHATGGIAVGDILRAVPISRSGLERRFKQILGRTLHDEILRVKLENVKRMLVTTDLPMVAVAARSGFEHAEYLSVAFRRVFGLAPNAFRARHQAGKLRG